MRTVLKWSGLTLFTIITFLFSFVWWASGGQTNEALVSAGDIIKADAAVPAGLPAEIGVISFNIGYGRGPDGDHVGPWTKAHIEKHLDGIAAQIAASGADLAALQEVDLASARSHHIHQGRYLAERLGWPAASCVVTWENNYVPYPYWPPSRHYGQMKSGQCLLSRFPITRSTRYRLPQPESNPWWRNIFYLNRAIEHAEVRLSPDRVLHVYNVHAEAFDRTNRVRHAKRLVALLAENPSADVVALGDLNAPPADAPQLKGFEDEPESDFTGDPTIALVAASPPLSEVMLGQAPALTFPAHAANRRLDYIFHRAGLALQSAKVLGAQPPWSDHLPVSARFTLTPR